MIKMKLFYHYKGSDYQTAIDWGTEKHSAVFQNLRKELENRHHIVFTEIGMSIGHMDSLVDIIYEQIYSAPQHLENTYNPALPRTLQEAMFDLVKQVNELSTKGESGIFYLLCCDAILHLQEIVDIFIEDNRYQGKMRKRNESSLQTLNEGDMPVQQPELLGNRFDSDELLVVLTETQKRRFTQYVILKYTMQEIADNEKVGVTKIQKSIVAAYKKLRKIKPEL